MRSVVIIPTYNEIENIGSMITSVLNLSIPFDILIVDDNSPDGTALHVKELQNRYSDRLHLLSRASKSGLGTAYIAGFKWALAHGFDFVFEIDCDFSHPPDKLVELYNALQDGSCDVAIGSRYFKGVRVKNWPAHRLFLSLGASFYVRILTLMPICDPTAGFIGYSRKALTCLRYENIPFQGYGFQIAMKFWLWKAGLKLREIPILFVERQFGTSKMSSSIIKEALFGVLSLTFQGIFKPKSMIKI